MGRVMQAAGPQPAAISGRGGADDLAKDSSEVALIAKAHFLADARHGLVSIGKQRLSSLYAVVIEVFHERKTCHMFKETHKVRLAHAADTSRFADLNRIPVILSQIVKQRSKSVEGAPLALKNLYGSGVRRVVVYQLHKNHLQICAQCQPGSG